MRWVETGVEGGKRTRESIDRRLGVEERVRALKELDAQSERSEARRVDLRADLKAGGELKEVNR